MITIFYSKLTNILHKAMKYNVYFFIAFLIVPDTLNTGR